MRFAVACSLVPCIYAYAINRGGLPTDSGVLDPSPIDSEYVLPTHFLLEQTQPGLSASLEPLALDPYPDRPRVTFNENGSFKLTIFSDVHFGENPWDSWGPE